MSSKRERHTRLLHFLLSWNFVLEFTLEIAAHLHNLAVGCQDVHDALAGHRIIRWLFADAKLAGCANGDCDYTSTCI